MPAAPCSNPSSIAPAQLLPSKLHGNPGPAKHGSEQQVVHHNASVDEVRTVFLGQTGRRTWSAGTESARTLVEILFRIQLYALALDKRNFKGEEETALASNGALCVSSGEKKGI